MTTEAVIVNLDSTLTLAAEAIGNIRTLNGARVAPGNNPLKADIKRDLIYLSDTLDRAAAEARAVYHTVNGKDDPLEGQR